MCGIFAFAGPRTPDLDMLRTAATQAARRGPHAHGWVTRTPELHVHHALGPVSRCTTRCSQSIPEVVGPRVLGHSRLATFGAPDDIDGTQPLMTIQPDGRRHRHALAHNGNVYNAEHLAQDMPSDSAALAAVYSTFRAKGDTPSEALRLTVQVADQKAWAIVVLDGTGEMVAHRHGLPLFRYTHPTGVYLSSVAFPGAVEVPADTILREAPAL